MIARTMPIRCCSPPDNSLGMRFAYSAAGRPTLSKSSSVLEAICSLVQPFISGMRAIFSSTVKLGNRAMA